MYYIRVQVVDINQYCGKLHFSPLNKRHTFDFDMYQVNRCTLLYSTKQKKSKVHSYSAVALLCIDSFCRVLCSRNQCMS